SLIRLYKTYEYSDG
ncbi:unnamed protein product, partial [Rotaria magnacalcarata]